MYLIIGGDSIIGKALSAFWEEKKIPYCASTRRSEQVNQKRPYIDLASLTWPELETGQYDAVVFCAAATKLADCEEYPETTRAINVEATLALVRFMALRGSYLLFLSTNQVFDGTKPHRKVSDKICPINEYGRQKADAERLFRQESRSAVLRLSKVIYPDLPLLRHWESRLQKGQSIEAYTDMYLAPISLEKVVKRIDQLLQNKEPGIFHISGEEDVSYYSFAKSYFSDIPNADKLIQKSTFSKTDLLGIKFPRYTSLQ
ncbi:MAG: sugar nucleotide-binding protein [SAR324 cluster bacterium]|nr:sugar nucleotide-binding protein [SAR324 cluster bacterium]